MNAVGAQEGETAPGEHAKESRQPSIQLQLLPSQPGRSLPSATLLGWNLKATHTTTATFQNSPSTSALCLCLCLACTPQTRLSPIRMSAALVAVSTFDPSASLAAPRSSITPLTEHMLNRYLLNKSRRESNEKDGKRESKG